MSQLRVSAQGQPDFFLNVTDFDSPVYGEMNSAQTKSQVQYFPIKAYQPELVCNVMFPSEFLWEQWQTWVRQNMINSQNSNSTGNPGVTLNWPQRNINNWTGIIAAAKAGGMRQNYTPRVRVEFQLVASLVSNLGVFASFGSVWQSITGSNAVGSVIDSLFTLPASFLGGSTTPGNANIIAGGGSAASSLASLVNPASSLSLLSGLIPGL
jgi:hypothetical protein